MVTYDKNVTLRGKSIRAELPLAESKAQKRFFEKKVFRALLKISKRYKCDVACRSECFEDDGFISVLVTVSAKNEEFAKCIIIKDGAFYKPPKKINMKLCTDATAKSERKARISKTMYGDVGYLAKKYFKHAMLIPIQNGTKICYPPNTLSDVFECFVSDVKIV